MKTPLPSLAVAALLAISPMVSAQQSSATTPVVPPTQTLETAAPVARAPYTLKPFVATYRVLQGDRHLGDATLQLVNRGGQRWRIDLMMRGSGLLRLAGLNVEQSTVFDSPDGVAFVPVSQSTVKRAGFKSKRTIGVYRWGARSAQWTGDLKETRRAPVALRAGDLSALLINLAVIRDAEAGKTLSYRMVDEGRAAEQTYAVAAASQDLQVGDITYDALRVDRAKAGGDATTFWVAYDVPTPLRILQTDEGKPGLDLQLIEYRN